MVESACRGLQHIRTPSPLSLVSSITSAYALPFPCLFPACPSSHLLNSRDLRLAPGLSAAGFTEEIPSRPVSEHSPSTITKSGCGSTAPAAAIRAGSSSSVADVSAYDASDILSPGPIDAALQAICRGPDGPVRGEKSKMDRVDTGGDGVDSGAGVGGIGSRGAVAPEAVIMLTRLGGPRCSKNDICAGGSSSVGDFGGSSTDTEGKKRRGETDTRPQQEAAVATADVEEGESPSRHDGGNAGHEAAVEEKQKSGAGDAGGQAEETTEPASKRDCSEKRNRRVGCSKDNRDNKRLEVRELEEIGSSSPAAVATARRLQRFWDRCAALAKAVENDAANTMNRGATVAAARRRSVLLHVCSGPGATRAVQQALARGEGGKAGAVVVPICASNQEVGEEAKAEYVFEEETGRGRRRDGAGGGGVKGGVACRIGGTTVAALGSLRKDGVYCVVELGLPVTDNGGGSAKGAAQGRGGESGGIGVTRWSVASVRFGQIDVSMNAGNYMAGGERLNVRSTTTDSTCCT